MNLPFLSTERSTGWLKPFAGATGVLIIVTLFLFWDSLDPALILFSNDGPLGSISTDAIEMPGTFSGYWHDLNWLGYEQPSASPGIYMALGLLLQKSVLYLKWCTPICLVILGLSAWFFFRTLGFRNLACTIGAVAAAFNMESSRTPAGGCHLGRSRSPRRSSPGHSFYVLSSRDLGPTSP